MKDSTYVGESQINERCGVTYSASGNLLIIKQTSRTVPKQFDNSRSAINRFSAGAARRMRRYLRTCRPNYTGMVTLTYPYEYPADGRIVKEHLRRFLQECQRYVKRSPDICNIMATTEPSFFWFLEFQARGAPHFHIFANCNIPKHWVAATWYRIVNSEDERHLHAGTRVEFLRAGRSGTISYASKYAAKAEQKDVPEGYENVGRFWGVYGDRVTLSAATFVSSADRLKSNVSNAEKHLYSRLKKMIDWGEAEVIKREEGVLLVSINGLLAVREIRRCVGNIMAQTMRFEDLFVDAEVDYGVHYNA